MFRKKYFSKRFYKSAPYKTAHMAKVIRLKGGTKKERKIYRLVASLDHFVVRLVLVLIVLYVVAYGYFISNGFMLGYPTWTYALILIPIWLVDGLKGLVEAFVPGDYKTAKQELSKITVVIPSKDGGEALARTLTDVRRRFAPENVIVVSNGSTDNTVSIAQSFGVTCLDIDAPVGKVRAINHALDQVITPYALLIDDDTLIGDASIPTGLLEEGYEAVAFRVLVNTSTWITRLQMYEYRKSTDVGKRFHNKKASVQNISGAIGLFNISELKRQVNHHTYEFAGEDLQRTLLIHLATKSKGVVLTDSVVYTDPPTSIKDLFNQRTLGWFPGLYTNFWNYVKLLFKRGVPRPLKYDAFYNSFLVMTLDVLRLISLPVIIFYPWYFVIMYAAYIILETISYFKCGSEERFWVVLAYPFYGLFGFITRICAFGVFLYRRIVARLARTVYRDDYKSATIITKVITIVIIMLAAESVLLSYIAFVHADLIDLLSTPLR